MSINSIANLEVEENLQKAVDSSNIEKIEDLFSRFTFNEENIMMMAINCAERDINLAVLLLSKSARAEKEKAVYILKNKNLSSAKQLVESIDL